MFQHYSQHFAFSLEVHNEEKNFLLIFFFLSPVALRPFCSMSVLLFYRYSHQFFSNENNELLKKDVIKKKTKLNRNKGFEFTCIVSGAEEQNHHKPETDSTWRSSAA